MKSQDYDGANALIKTLHQKIDFNQLSAESKSYSRYILSNKDNYWLMLIHWDKGAKTPIHGHPEQMFVYLLEGQLQVEDYKVSPLQKTQTISCQPHDYQIHHGRKHCLDNAVHCISALEKSISLHFYSSDPRICDTFTPKK